MKTTDFLQHDFKEQRYDLVIMNPPFSGIGKSIVTKALSLSDNLAFIMNHRIAIDTLSSRGRIRKRSELWNRINQHLYHLKILPLEVANKLWKVRKVIYIGVYAKAFNGKTTIDNTFEVFKRDLRLDTITPGLFKDFDKYFDANSPEIEWYHDNMTQPYWLKCTELNPKIKVLRYYDLVTKTWLDKVTTAKDVVKIADLYPSNQTWPMGMPLI